MPDPPVFPFAGDPIEPLLETPAYPTSVITAEAGNEQRVQRRRTPAESIEFSIQVMPDIHRRPGELAREQALLDAFLYGNQAEIVAIPLWQFSNRLAGDVAIGANAIPVDTRWIPYRAGEHAALVWRDTFTWELFSIDTFNDTTITTADVATKAWPSGKAIVVPVRIGRLQDRVSVKRVTRAIAGARIRFTMQSLSPDGAPTPPATGLPTYLGYDVLDIEAQQEASSDDVVRRVYVLDNETGAWAAESPVAAPSLVRPLLWLCMSRQEAWLMRAFLDARRGRAIPFWLIAREDDLELATDALATDTTLTVLETGYTAYQFPAIARRHLAVRSLGGDWAFHKVTGSVNNGDGTETLTITPALGGDLVRRGAMVSFLRFVRQDSDASPIRWTSGHLAEAEIPVREIPTEVPA